MKRAIWLIISKNKPTRCLRVQWLLLMLLVYAGAPAAAQNPFADQNRVTAMGFAELDYREANDGGPTGFIIGQAVGHLTARIDDRLRLFTEATATARRQTDFEFEIERLSVHYDFSDQFRFSAGRYHSPLGFWNAAYHHGSWLQTTIGRPHTVRFGSNVVPIHFVGALMEGRLAQSDFSYRVGVGNGRSDRINHPGDFGDINNNRAWFASAHFAPLGRRRLDSGISVYLDKASPVGRPAIDERLVSAYLALHSETPELIVEYHYGDHDDGVGAQGKVRGIYGQLSWRLSGNAAHFKPYMRIESLSVDDSNPLLAGAEPDYDGLTAGVRWDFSQYAALKGEFRSEEFDHSGRESSVWLQLALVVDGVSRGQPAIAPMANLPNRTEGRVLR